MQERQETVGIVVALTAALFAVIVAVIVAALLAAPAAGEVAGAPSASCQEWTDGCVVCARAPERLACSTPGIACTRGPARCLRP
jgi:hypothetical protein